MKGKTIRTSIISWLIVGISGIVMLAAISVGFVHVAAITPDGTFIEATGRGDIDFRVFYFDNQLFPENPVPKNLHFLRHFTEFIEIDSGFSLWFSGGQEFYVDIVYTAQKRFEISYLGGQPGHNPVVFEQIDEISRVETTVFANHINFRPMSRYGGYDRAGGAYFVHPDDFMAIFADFLEYNDSRLQPGTNLRGFSAELTIEFTLHAVSQAAGLNEVIRRGYRIPIGVNVFSLDPFGAEGFTSSMVATQEANSVSLQMMGGLGAALAAGGLGLFIGAKKLVAKPEQNKHRQEYQAIMKKYGNEIISSSTEADLSKFLATPVESFDELLKLSLNTGKLIVCHNQGDRAVFYTVVDDVAFNYAILFFERTSPTDAAESAILIRAVTTTKKER